MGITIPDVIQFSRYDEAAKLREFLCFKHAVLAAIDGKHIDLELQDYPYTCNECRNG